MQPFKFQDLLKHSIMLWFDWLVQLIMESWCLKCRPLAETFIGRKVDQHSLLDWMDLCGSSHLSSETFSINFGYLSTNIS